MPLSNDPLFHRQNAAELRQLLISGSETLPPNLCLLKAELVSDLRVALVAAAKAKLARDRGKMVTRTVGTEVAYNMRYVWEIRLGDDDYITEGYNITIRICYILL